MSKTWKKAALHAPAGCGWRFWDLDICNCYVTLLCNFLESKDDLADFPILIAFRDNYKTWRAFLTEYFGWEPKQSKKELIRLLHLAFPRSELPCLWGLARDLSSAVDVFLSYDEFAYLKGTFSDRRSPKASRLHYALANLEDQVLTAVEGEIARAAPDVKIMTYMFDGAIVCIFGDDEPKVREALQVVSDARKVKFSLEPF